MSVAAAELPTARRSALELLEALERMDAPNALTWDVRYWKANLKAALEREAVPPDKGRGA